jgi:glycosyltransferase involved in cell wall biosynthesis
MNKKKIIIGITHESSVNLLLGQLAHFKSLGYQTYLLAPYSPRSAAFCEKEGCEHLIINIEREIAPLKDLKTLYTIIKIFIKIKPDIINLGTPKISLLGMIAGFITVTKKRIYTCRGFRFEHEKGLKKGVLILMEKITVLFAHKVICISQSVKKIGINNRIFNETKTIVIHKGSSNGLNLNLFNPDDKNNTDLKKELITKYNLENTFVFGFLGRIVDRKGINELFVAFNEIYKNNNTIKLFLIGPFDMDQISDKTLVEKINHHPGIINYGKVKQEDVPGFMSAMDVFVLPAWWEGFGNVLIQAAAMGIPVISTEGTGTIDAVSDGYNGILVPVKDKLKLQFAMEKLMNDANERNVFGKNGIDWARNFDREIIWNNLNKIYQN